MKDIVTPTDGYKSKYEETYAELLVARKNVKQLKDRIRSIEKKWSLEMFSYMQKRLEEYQPKLNPAKVSVKASLNRKSLVFEINPKDVVCVLTRAKKKHIYLKQPIESIKGEYILTNEIIVNRNDFTLNDMCNELDRLNFWLVQVSNFAIVNVDDYHLNNRDKLQLKDFTLKEGREISLGPEYTENYKKVKEHFDDVISLQRLVFRGIV
jgi:hypothetical protein